MMLSLFAFRGNGYETMITTTSAAASNVSKGDMSSSTPPPPSPLQPLPSTPIQQPKLPLESKHRSDSTNSTESFIMIAAPGAASDSPYQRGRSCSPLPPNKPGRRKIVPSSSSAASLENGGLKGESTEEAATLPSPSPLPPSLATADSTINPIQLVRKNSSAFKQPFGKRDLTSASTATAGCSQISQAAQQELSAVLLKRLHQNNENDLTTKSSPAEETNNISSSVRT
eukprot:scaffold633_cov288-Ochromonas_danica.AAC.72